MSSSLAPPLAGLAAAIIMVVLHCAWPRTSLENQVMALLVDGPKMMPELLWRTGAPPVALAGAVGRLMASNVIEAQTAPPGPHSNRARATYRLVGAHP